MLDLDHLGAEVAEHGGGERTGEERGEVDDPQPGQGGLRGRGHAASISVRYGMEVEAPGRCTHSAAADDAQASARGTGRRSPSATASVPTKVSPAPVVSTAVTSGAGKSTGSPPRAAYRQPFEPSVMT